MLHKGGPPAVVSHKFNVDLRHRLVRSRPIVRRAAEKVEMIRLVGVSTARRAAADRRTLRPLGESARNAVYDDMWRGASTSVGATYERMGPGYGEIRRGAASTRVFQQFTVLDDPVVLRRLLHTHDLQEKLRARGIAVADSVQFTPQDPRPARELIARTGPCVVKPALGTAGGDGVTVGVGADDLPLAMIVASRFSDKFVAERWVPGYLFRILLLDGEVLDVIRDDAPHVVGNGRSSIGDLVSAENLRREAAFGRLGLSYWELDLDTALTLRRSGHRAKDVVAPGVAVQVKTVSNDRRVEESVTYRGQVHPSVIDHARATAATVGLRLAGIDVMAPAIDLPLVETGGVVLEANGSPGIHRHYQVSDPAGATDVASLLLQALLG